MTPPHLSLQLSLIHMSASELPQLRAILQKHKENESVYRERIREINATRSKVSEQLSALQLAYDRKLKASDQKLQTLRSQHDALLRQNILYRAEIESYQGRLIEKEKIIAMLLNQRKDLGGINSSDRSKSDKTDSVNANEDEQKNFKKQNGLFKEEMEALQNFERSKEELQSERVIAEVGQTVRTERVVEKGQGKVVAPPILPAKRKEPVVKEVKQEEEAVVEESVSVESKPTVVVAKEQPKSIPPPRAKTDRKVVKPTKRPKPKPEPEEEPQEVEQSSHTFFTNFNDQQQQYHESKAEIHPQTPELPLFHTQEEVYHEELPQPEEIETHQPAYEQKYQQEVIATEEYYQPPPETYEEVAHQTHFQPPPHEASPSNFWNNFGQTEQPEEPTYVPKAKPKKKVIKTAANFDNEPSNSTDFFSQLGKAEPQPTHHLQIQESSIDHMDRDNSLISNEQAYFAQDQALPKPQARPVKMAKKKGKRDQIKVVDPSRFG